MKVNFFPLGTCGPSREEYHRWVCVDIRICGYVLLVPWSLEGVIPLIDLGGKEAGVMHNVF